MLRCFTFITIGLTCLGLSIPAYACACCAEENAWVQREMLPYESEYLQTEFENLHFTEGYFEDVPAFEEYYQVEDTRISEQNQKLAFVGKGFKGVFTLEGKGDYSHKDIGFEVNRNSKASSKALLLHELILTGHMTIKADGRADKELPAKLILQGINISHCFSPHNFTKWMVKLDGDILAGAGVLVINEPDTAQSEAKE